MALSLEYCSSCNRLFEIEISENSDESPDFICPVCKNPIFACEQCEIDPADCQYDGKTCQKYNLNVNSLFI